MKKIATAFLALSMLLGAGSVMASRDYTPAMGQSSNNGA